MKNGLILSLLLALMAALHPSTLATPHNDRELEWFRGAKLGLFIHWGLYSQTAGEWKGKPSQGGEHFMLYERIPLREYAAIAKDFNPVNFNASEWAKAAKRSGMKYLVYTTKHHDGFAMYDSKCSDYNIVKQTPFKRDPLKELAAACRKEGIKLGLYYSLGRDWEDPDVPTNWPKKAGRSNTWDYPDEDSKQLSAYIERKVKPQLRELLTGYGRIDILWFDTPELVTKQQSREIRELIQTLQPGCLVNDRIGNGMGDYSTVEQRLTNAINPKPWEACLTMGKNWGYNKFDTTYKSPVLIIRHLADVVSKGGNLLLNIGPDGKGKFPELTQPALEELHNWLAVNGEAIYGTRPWIVAAETVTETSTGNTTQGEFHDAVYDGTPKDRTPDLRFTSKNNCIYIVVRDVAAKNYTVKSINKNHGIKSISLLGTAKPVKWTIDGGGLQIDLSGHQQLPPVYVLKAAH